jgi:chemotaxis protein methyltransferase CheR
VSELPWYIVETAADLIRRRTGLIFPASRRASFASALARASRRAGNGDPDDYLARLGVHPPLLEALVDEITVGETYFFREPRQFDVIREAILPALAVGHPARRPLRVWSAASATGEEPYTLAIVLREQGWAGNTHLVATDLSVRALAAARRARYSRWSLRGVSDLVIATYFRPDGERFDLVPAIREMVDFRYLNLAEESYPSLATGIWGMDLILCRNVLIYFDAETIARVARRLIDTLSPDGWLLLGASDPPLHDLVACEVTVTEAGVVYQRPGRDRPHLPKPAYPSAPWTPPELDLLESPVLASAPVLPVPHVDDRQEALRLYAEREYERAAEVAGRLTRRRLGEPTPWVVLVRSLANRGDLGAAGRACATALDRHSASAELHYLHAVLLGEGGSHHEAAAASRRALYLDRGLVVAHLALAGSLSRCGDPEGARRALRAARRALADTPPDTIVPASDGESARRLGELADAQLELLRDAVA